MLTVIIIIIVVGLLHIFTPEVVWFLNHGLHNKNAEPGEHSELLYRIAGVIWLIVGIVLIVSEVTK